MIKSECIEMLKKENEENEELLTNMTSELNRIQSLYDDLQNQYSSVVTSEKMDNTN